MQIPTCIAENRDRGSDENLRRSRKHLPGPFHDRVVPALSVPAHQISVFHGRVPLGSGCCPGLNLRVASDAASPYYIRAANPHVVCLTEKPTKIIRVLTVLSLLMALPTCRQRLDKEAALSADTMLREQAQRLAQGLIIIDTHIDVPDRLIEKMEDISVRTPDGDFDYPRAKAGGLNAPFMSIYVPTSYENNGAKKYADQLIDMVEKFTRDWPDKFALARSPADVRTNFRAGLMSLPMGMENGAPVEGNLANLKYFFDRGIRYITLAHAKDNHICDASFDPVRKWNGLSLFGREVVTEMNRLGIMIDVSHISDSAFFQVIRLTKAPVIASHSSCRYFTPNWERNMNDEMIRAIAGNGGVIQINFASMFLTEDLQKKWVKEWDDEGAFLAKTKLASTDSARVAWVRHYREDHGIGFADISDVVAHIDHVVELVGPDHVGLGSDFDGAGDSFPTGLKDVADYPNLIYELLRRNYSEEDIKKICGENLLSVWTKVEQVAREMQSR
jgi:membrane dipeptidase